MTTTADILNTSQTSTKASSKASGFSSLTSEDFTKVIISELSNQDPLSPSDTNALLQQLSTIRNIQSSIDLSDKLGALVSDNQFSSASTVIGKVVGGVSTDNSRVIGKVVSVSKTDDGIFLNLNTGQQLSMKNMDGIIDPSSLTDDEKKLLGLL
ncbi:MAG: flagellar hook capping FlgD N-terminal domain-containing protein [Phycisphaerales bacterium]|nr:hypothetical protein [Planctomycetota bacterium]